MDTADRAGDSVLATLITYYTPVAAATVAGIVAGRADFLRERQQIVYAAVVAMAAQGQHVDVLTLQAFLEAARPSASSRDQRPLLERAGGGAYLELLATSSVPSALADHARLVAEDARWRRLARAVLEVEEGVQDRDDALVSSGLAALARDARGGRPALRVVDAA